jgi:hypothetical protein
MTLVCERCGLEFDGPQRYEAHLKRKVQCKAIKAPVINVITEESVGDHTEFQKSIDADVLKPFDMNALMGSAKNDEFAVIMSASRKAGKSYLLAHLYPQWVKIFDLIVTFSYSAHNTTYDFVTDVKFNDYEPQMIKDLFIFQRETKNKFRILVIFDDLVSSKVKYDDAIMQCYTRGRNSNISVVVSTQIFKLLNKNNRGNTDYMFIGKTNTAENRKTLCETVLTNSVKTPASVRNKVMKEDYMDKWLLNKTQDHKFVVIDMKNDNESIYEYKAP